MPTYLLAKEQLARIQTPLTESTETQVKNSAEFMGQIREKELCEGEIMQWRRKTAVTGGAQWVYHMSTLIDRDVLKDCHARGGTWPWCPPGSATYVMISFDVVSLFTKVEEMQAIHSRLLQDESLED